MRDGWNYTIDAVSMSNGIGIADYFVAHALAAFDHMGADPLFDADRWVVYSVDVRSGDVRVHPDSRVLRQGKSGPSHVLAMIRPPGRASSPHV